MYFMKDFDSTGQYHEKYAAQWMSYLRSVASGCDQLQSSIPSGLANPITVCICCFTAIYPPLRLFMQKVGVKDRLDTMLKEWKPKNFKTTKVEGMVPVRVRCFHHYMAVMNL